ncbi:uncharacterized protein LOC117090892 [Trachypithecus francoisi]|uniref:uncharacterized protein LOC117090892 n=1 Tax=Trachypithecus francoisi TaxID=54180 RepID=UPI00141BB414|nr:uncharacterized protein LOC117090892 [Trachypithecus francoisi]
MSFSIKCSLFGQKIRTFDKLSRKIKKHKEQVDKGVPPSKTLDSGTCRYRYLPASAGTSGHSQPRELAPFLWEVVTPPDSRSLRPPRARPGQAGCRRRKFGRAPPPGGALSARPAQPLPQDPGPGRRTFIYLLPSLALRCRRCAAHPRCPVSHPQHTDPTRTPEARPQALEVRPRPSHTG